MGFKEFFLEQQRGQIYADLDGVLVNFDKGWQDRTQNIYGRRISRDDYEKEFSKNKAYKFGKSLDFDHWVNLEKMPDANVLWDYISKFNPNILSASPQSEDSIMGKRMWVKNNLNPQPNKVILDPEKWKYVSSPSDILIDDTPKKINQWKKAGGIGILHTSAKDTIIQLKRLGF